LPDSDETTARNRAARFLRWWHRRRFRVADRSMMPTLLPGDRLYVDTRAYRDRTPARGDLVVAREADPPHRFFVKRVAFVAGETVSPTGEGVPEGHVFLVGDNAELSRDSRRFGSVPLAHVIGRVYRCYSPPDRRREL
jgi:signal peptidase I